MTVSTVLRPSKLIFGQGVNDVAGFSHSPVYVVWHSMLRRAYSEVYQKSKPTYRAVEVCEEWKTFSNFIEWYKENHIEGWQLDKDILAEGSKIYSPNSCCFVPNVINSAFARHGAEGVYFKKANNRFCAQISDSNESRKTLYLGLFESEQEATRTYNNAKGDKLLQLAKEYEDRIKPLVYDAIVLRALKLKGNQ